MSLPRKFDLALSYPQWQGSSRPEKLERGARAAAEVCGRYAPLERVASSGEGEAAGGVKRWTAIAEQMQSARDILARERPRSVLTAGGDCSVDVAIIDYLHGLYPDLTVIWIDAHLDANTPETSPSGCFHGMPVATILGSAPDGLELSNPLPASQFRYVAADVGDDGDWTFQKANWLRWLLPDEVIDGPVHIHFDLDVLNPAEFPFLAYTDGRLPIADGVSLVRRFAPSLVGLTVTEFAPADDDEAAEGSQTIARLYDAATGS